MLSDKKTYRTKRRLGTSYYEGVEHYSPTPASVAKCTINGVHVPAAMLVSRVTALPDPLIEMKVGNNQS
jgi:hypothetical protein